MTRLGTYVKETLMPLLWQQSSTTLSQLVFRYNQYPLRAITGMIFVQSHCEISQPMGR